MPTRATPEELQAVHDSVRRVLPPLPVALARPAIAALLELGAAMQRKAPPKRADHKLAAAGERDND